MCKFHDPSVIGSRDTEGGFGGVPPPVYSRLLFVFVRRHFLTDGDVSIAALLSSPSNQAVFEHPIRLCFMYFLTSLELSLVLS